MPASSAVISHESLEGTVLSWLPLKRHLFLSQVAFLHRQTLPQITSPRFYLSLNCGNPVSKHCHWVSLLSQKWRAPNKQEPEEPTGDGGREVPLAVWATSRSPNWRRGAEQPQGIQIKKGYPKGTESKWLHSVCSRQSLTLLLITNWSPYEKRASIDETCSSASQAIFTNDLGLVSMIALDGWRVLLFLWLKAVSSKVTFLAERGATEPKTDLTYKTSHVTLVLPP